MSARPYTAAPAAESPSSELAPRGARAVNIHQTLFAVGIFANAFMLFLLEPLFGKLALPHLGGTAAVWTTCMLFFQAALLGGYYYAHALAARLQPSVQAAIHVTLLVLAALTLPVSIPSAWSPADVAAPQFSLLRLLALRIGAPFVLLAAGSPLLQAWFARARGTAGRDPYTLYVASNLGSAAALLAYPFVFEPLTTLTQQSRMWTAGYFVLIVVVAACGVAARRLAPRSAPMAIATSAKPVTWRDRARWTLLAAVPSSLLLGVTTHLTTDLAPIPLLWVLPLALYLLTFVVAFSEWGPRATNTVLAVLPYAVLAIAALLVLKSEVPGPAGYALHLVVFFICALACHLRLAASRPVPARLTEFYLWLSLGGVIGGVFNVLIAPVAFNTVVEYPLALVAAVALSRPRRSSWPSVLVATAAAVVLVAGAALLARRVGDDRTVLTALVAAGAVAAFVFRARPVQFAVAAGALITAGAQFQDGTTRFAGRSFYGVYRVVDNRELGVRQFYSGTTIHGSERLTEFSGALADSMPAPLAYYHRQGPLGSLFAARSWHPGPWRVGAIGLGAGASATYARPGESWTFFEIDPLVADIAENERYFRFVSSAKAPQQIMLGDARLSIASEPPRSYDVLLVDAFSSDAIPVHLITREALALYRSKLAPDGMIAWHISNKYLDLRPVLAALARDARMHALIDVDVMVGANAGGRLPSIWVAITASDSTAAAIAKDPKWQPLRVRRERLWTDDFSNLLSVLK